MNLSEKEVVLFDLDGTVIDSQMGIFNSIYHVFDVLNMNDVDRSYATMKQFIGPSIGSSFKRIYGFDEESAVNAVNIYREYYAQKGYLECTVYDGLEQLLVKLKKAGKKIGLATKKPEPFTLKIMKEKNLLAYFDCICGSSLAEIDDSKTHIIKKCASSLSQNMDFVVHIGDTHYDVESAKAAGVDCIAVLYGFESECEMQNPAPTAFANNMAELALLLGV